MTKKRLVVLGGGESGVGTALLAKAKGYEVFVSDKGKIKVLPITEIVSENDFFDFFTTLFNIA